jgi:hypothetical protein
MNNHKVSAQSLISWQRKTEKCEKSEFENLKVQLEIAPASAGTAGRRGCGYGSRV